MDELRCTRSISDNIEKKDRFCPPHTSVQFCHIPLVCFSDRISLTVLPGVDLDPVPTCDSLCCFLHGCDWYGFLLLHGIPLCLFLWPRVHTPAVLHNEKQLWRWHSWVGCSPALGNHSKGKAGKLQGGFSQGKWMLGLSRPTDPFYKVFLKFLWLQGGSSSFSVWKTTHKHTQTRVCAHAHTHTTTTANVLFKITYTV